MNENKKEKSSSSLTTRSKRSIRKKQLTLHDKFGRDSTETKQYQEILSFWGDNPDDKNPHSTKNMNDKR